MTWHTVAARGAGKDLWVRATGDGAPRYGVWSTPSGQDVLRVLDRWGPTALDVGVWWQQEAEHRGTHLTDMLWDTGMSGFKLVSRRLLDILLRAGGQLEVFEVDVRLENGDPVEGYVGILEPSDQPGPVHSLWRGRRSHRFVVSGEVHAAIEEAGLVGLEIEPVRGPFPADQPGYFEA